MNPFANYLTNVGDISPTYGSFPLSSQGDSDNV